MLFVILICVAITFSGAYAKTMADVQSCHHSSMTSCAQQCISEAPADKQSAIQQCFTANANTETTDDFSNCLATQGVTTCFKHKFGGRHGMREGRKGGNRVHGQGEEAKPRPRRQTVDEVTSNNQDGQGQGGRGKWGKHHGHEGNPLLKSFMECKHKCIKEKNCDDGCAEEMDDATKEKVRTCHKQSHQKGKGFGHRGGALKQCLKSIA